MAAASHSNHPAVLQIEYACQQFHQQPEQREQAEKILLQFKESPHAVKDSLHLIQHSRMPFAQFHGASTIRELCMRKWTEMSAEEKDYMRECMLETCVQRFEELEGFVIAQLVRTAGVLYKRGWMDDSMEKRLSVIHRMKQMVSSKSVQQQYVAGKFMFALVSEFSAGKASAMQMPLEFHARTRDAFQHMGLREAAAVSFTLLSDLVHSMSTHIVVGSSTGVKTVPPQHLSLFTVSLELCVEILSWEFSNDDTSTLQWNVSSSSASGSLGSTSMIYPGKEWSDLLIKSDLIACAFHAYRTIRELVESSAPYLARQLLIQLASLSGKVFDDSSCKVQYLGTIFNYTLQIIAHPLLDSSNSSSFVFQEAAASELLDLCQLIFSLVANMRLKVLIEHGSLASLVEQLTGLCSKLLHSANTSLLQNMGNAAFDVNHMWQLKGFDLLLDAWVILVDDPLVSSAAEQDAASQQATRHLQQHCVIVFEQYVQVQLSVASVEALQEAEEDDEVDTSVDLTEQLGSIASLARCNAEGTLTLLYMAVKDLFGRLQQEVSAAAGPPSNSECMTPSLSQVLEQMHFLIHLSGVVLADEYDRERPGIPVEIHRICQQASAAHSADIVVEMIKLILEILEYEGGRVEKRSVSALLSPYLSEQVLKTVTRIAAVYFAPSPEVNADVADTLSNAFDVSLMAGSSTKGGNSIVDFLIKQTCTYLSVWPTEPQVTQAVCRMLTVLSRGRTAEACINLPSWQLLLRTNATSGCFLSGAQSAELSLTNALYRLPSALRGLLTESICRCALSSADEGHRVALFEQIAQPVSERLHRLVREKELGGPSSFVNNVVMQENVKLVLELHIGIVNATGSTTYRLINAFCLPALDAIVQMMDVFHGHSQIVCLVLQFFCSLTESQITYLPPQEALAIYNACGAVLKTYSKHNLGKRSRLADHEDESFEDVLKLLDLLSFLIAKDCIDFSDVSVSNQVVDSAVVAVSDVVFFGLGLVIPLMTEELLQYPTLCLHFFNVISYMIENYASKLAAIDTNLFSMMMKTIAFGIQHHVKVEVVRHSLNALSELASYHVKATRTGEAGLQCQLQHNNGLFLHFLQQILQTLLFDDYQSDVQPAYASAVLPLILCHDASQYHQLARDFAAQQTDAVSQQRLMALFGGLVQKKDGKPFGLDRFSRREFKDNLKDFVNNARGFLQIK